MANERPSICRFGYVSTSGRKKRLYGDYLTWLQSAGITTIEVADDALRLLVQTPPDTMAGQIPDYPETM